MNPKANLDNKQSPLPMVSIKMPQVTKWWVQMLAKFDFTLFSIPTEIKMTFENVNTKFSAAISSNEIGQIVPIITDLDYSIENNTIDIENSYWVGWLAVKFVKFIEKMTNFLVTDFGLPLANMIIPSAIQGLLRNQVMRIPVTIPYFKYYDEFYLDYKFTQSPGYVPDSLEFFFNGDLYHRT